MISVPCSCERRIALVPSVRRRGEQGIGAVPGDLGDAAGGSPGKLRVTASHPDFDEEVVAIRIFTWKA